MNTVQISIQANEAEQEILISELSGMGAEGFEQMNELLIAYFNEQSFRSYDVSSVLSTHTWNMIVIPEQNWNAVWESNFKPVVIGDFCIVRADFHEPVAGIRHEIIITPKMSFGTGHHATTHLMIEAMNRMDFGGKTVFDFGTGTGILSILAEKMGASSVEAIDVDHWSIENAEENTQKNKCSRIKLTRTSALPEGAFDIILANINRNVILDYLPRLKWNWHEKSTILFSGLLTTDEEIIVEAASMQGLQLVIRTEKENWICLLFMPLVTEG